MKLNKNILMGSKNTENTGCQYCEQKKKNGITKTVLWVVTLFAVLSFGHPYLPAETSVKAGYNGALLANDNIYSSKQILPVRQTGTIQTTDTTKHEPVQQARGKKVELKITGMACTGCSTRCQKVLFDFKGIIDADVNYEKASATIRYNPDSTNVEKIIQRIEEIGFKAEKSDGKGNNK